jgi:hypothetical protein
MKKYSTVFKSDDYIESSKSIRVDKNKIMEILERVASVEKNFIGFIDEDGITLQFYVNSNDEILVEIPVQSELGSYGTQITEQEMKEIVEDLESPYFNYKNKLNLSFLAW